MQKLVSLGDLAKELGVNKSKLTFYVKLGLLVPHSTPGYVNIFDHTIAVKQIKKIQELQTKKNMKLSAIKEVL